LTVGDGLSTSTYDPKEYLSYFHDGNLVGHHQGNEEPKVLTKLVEIEILRPKSPVSNPQVSGLTNAISQAMPARC